MAQRKEAEDTHTHTYTHEGKSPKNCTQMIEKPMKNIPNSSNQQGTVIHNYSEIQITLIRVSATEKENRAGFWPTDLVT